MLEGQPADPVVAVGGLQYPDAPWRLQGQLWLSLFRLGAAAGADRPAGVYGAAFVSYEPGSDLTYSELLVARPVRVPTRRGRRVNITDIWVDSPASMQGGRELWAIPKDLCDFRHESIRRGPLTTADWSASVERRPIAHASFRDVSRAAPRLPFRGGTWQTTTSGEARSAPVRGSARALPCRGRWDFEASGPLGWLRAARPLASFRTVDFRLTFG